VSRIDELLEEAQRESRRLHGIAIRGPGWSGDPRGGFLFRGTQAVDQSGEGTPPIFIGACCLGEACSILSAADCADAGGVYLGDFTACFPNPCGALPPCDECFYPEFGDPSDPPKGYRNYSRIRIGTYNFDNITTDVQYTMTVNEDLEKHKEFDEEGNCIEITDTDIASSSLMVVAAGVIVTDCNHPFDTDCWTDSVPECGDPHPCFQYPPPALVVDAGDHQYVYNDCDFSVGDPQECHYEFSEHIDEYLTDECDPG
jgi:hypothetical protein